MPRIDKYLEDKPTAASNGRPVSARLTSAPDLTEPRLEEAEQDVQRIDDELKRQADNFRQREKPEVNAGRPADARLKAERKGVI